MTWIQIAVAVPAAMLAWTLVRDFLAGLGEDRLWSDPEVDAEPAPLAGREWAEMSARIYDFHPRPASARELTEYPLNREA